MSAPEIFISRSRYWLTKEYPIKLRLCVNALPRSAVWARPNQSSNSIGNLIVHLTGNVSEWILGGIGGRSVTRFRAGEFAQTDGADGSKLLDNLEKDLERSIVIQDRETTVLSAVYHVVEHFSMHTGQIIFLTKIYAPDKIHFYDDAGGLAQPVWHLGTDLDEAAH